MVKMFKAKGVAAVAVAPNARAQPVKGGQDEWTTRNNKKGKNIINDGTHPNQASMSYSQAMAMKPPLQVKMPTQVALHNPEILALHANENEYGIPLKAMVIKKLEAKDGSHTWGH